MDKLSLQNPLFATYVIAATLMILKVIAMAWLTVVRMTQAKGGFRSPEDLKLTPLNPEPNPAQLAPKERVVSIESDPAGADIYVDGSNTSKLTPAEVTLTAAQALKPRIRVALRRPGFKQADQVLDAKAWTEGDNTMTASFTVKLVVAPKVTPTTTGTGSGAGAGAGSGETGTGTETGSAAPPPPPPPPPAGSGGEPPP